MKGCPEIATLTGGKYNQGRSRENEVAGQSFWKEKMNFLGNGGCQKLKTVAQPEMAMCGEVLTWDFEGRELSGGCNLIERGGFFWREGEKG